MRETNAQNETKQILKCERNKTQLIAMRRKERTSQVARRTSDEDERFKKFKMRPQFSSLLRSLVASLLDFFGSRASFRMHLEYITFKKRTLWGWAG